MLNLSTLLITLDTVAIIVDVLSNLKMLSICILVGSILLNEIKIWMCLGLRPSFIDSVLENGVLLCHGCGKYN